LSATQYCSALQYAVPHLQGEVTFTIPSVFGQAVSKAALWQISPAQNKLGDLQTFVPHAHVFVLIVDPVALVQAYGVHVFVVVLHLLPGSQYAVPHLQYTSLIAESSTLVQAPTTTRTHLFLVETQYSSYAQTALPHLQPSVVSFNVPSRFEHSAAAAVIHLEYKFLSPKKQYSVSLHK
jgi:hypothetical protein